MVTQNTPLWEHWRQLAGQRWQPVRANSALELSDWSAQRGQTVIVDADAPGLPDWQDPGWQQRFQRLRVLVLSVKPDDDQGRLVLARGAAGYAHALTQIPVLERILQTIEEGNIWMGRALLKRLLTDMDSRHPGAADPRWAEGLTGREQEVARHAALGASNQEIGERLGISERTVRAHLTAVFEKLHVSDRLMLALRVHGISPEGDAEDS